MPLGRSTPEVFTPVQSPPGTPQNAFAFTQGQQAPHVMFSPTPTHLPNPPTPPHRFYSSPPPQVIPINPRPQMYRSPPSTPMPYTPVTSSPDYTPRPSPQPQPHQSSEDYFSEARGSWPAPTRLNTHESSGHRKRRGFFGNMF
jgi:hypothetical protein